MIEKKHGRINVSFLYTHPTGEQRVKVCEDCDTHRRILTRMLYV